MATTHALAGAAIAAAVALVAPEFAVAAFLGGVVGGAFPDLDLYRDHRRKLHFPTYYTVGAAATTGLALLVPTAVTVGLAVALMAAAFHARLDRYGGGLELRPWRGTSRRAVYDHARGRWYRPKRWVRYDGSPEDLLLATAFAAPGLLVFEGALASVIAAGLAVSMLYVVVRKELPTLAERIAARLPPTVRARIPERFLS
ncbi:MAG: metal-dependent hydrolase [Halobacteriaceae archaeon]